MKAILLFIIICSLLSKSCMPSWSQNNTVKASSILPDTMYTISFKEDIQPMLKTHCSPCHFEGGKIRKTSFR
jgi:hypothetical protein